MNNPFKKADHTTLIVLLGLTAVAAGAVAYLFLTEQGEDTRKGLKKKIKEFAKDAAAKAVSKKTGISKKAAKKAADAVVN